MTVSQKPLALLSVTDKNGLVDFAKDLHQLGFELLSTGGTAKLLRDAAIPVTDVSAYTGQGEILDGRVKTLHPKVHGGILFDRSQEAHVREAQGQGIRPIDLVVVNLYDFKKQALDRSLELSKAIEYIDIGGPCMLRAAAKNYRFAAPVIDPADYGRVIGELRAGALSLELRTSLAAKVFKAISRYDAMIAASFEDAVAGGMDELPKTLSLELQEVQSLRYGENPHQKAKFYSGPRSLAGGLQDARVLQGKELSYNNLLDVDAAAQLVADFPEYKAVAIIKHTNPCGAAIGSLQDSLLSVYQKALATDPKSAFGGIVASNSTIDRDTAEALSSLFLECIVAPSFSDEAKGLLASKKNLRLLELPYLGKRENPPKQLDIRSIAGGILVQERDQVRAEKNNWKLVTQKVPNDAEVLDMLFAMRVCKHVKSNAIVYAKDGSTLAVGAGQMSRIDSANFAAQKATEFGKSLNKAIMASDAFFPFRDSVDLAAKWGVGAIIQPGGSMRDDESIAACDEHGISMVFSQIRHFKH